MTEAPLSAILQMRRRVEALAGLALSPAARLVAWALVLHADAGGECWPGTATLRRLTGLDARSIRRIRPALAAAFEYAPGGSEPGARRRPSRYRFRLDRGPHVLGTTARPGTAAAADRGPHAPGTGDVVSSEPGTVCPPKYHQGPFEGPPKNTAPKNGRSTNVARIVREVTAASTPPWPQRAAR